MSNAITQKWLLNRRHVLRGIGTTIALPLLNCMLPLRNTTTDAPGRPKRSVFIYIPNGVNTLTWQIRDAGSDYQFTEPLKSLERHRQCLTPISGLHHPNGIGQAHQCDKIWLTGANTKHPDGQFRNTVSVDQLMAEAAGKDTRFSSLELSVTGGTLGWTRQGTPLPAEQKPGVVFERLFGEGPGGVTHAKRRLARRGSVLDLVLGDARSLRRDIGYEDRIKLDEYLESVREVETRTTRADAWLKTPKPHVDAATRAHLTRNIPHSEAGDYYRTMYDLMVLAVQTDMTRVISCMSGSESHGLALPEIGIAQNRHELSHHNGDPRQMQKLTRCDTFLTEQFSYFLDQLKSRTEQGESLLDNTMVLFGSGMAHGHSHGNANLPTIVAGGRSLGLRHGRHLDYNLPKIGQYNTVDVLEHYKICSRPVDEKARLSNLLLTMLQRMNVQAEQFGDSTGPVSEIVA